MDDLFKPRPPFEVPAEVCSLFERLALQIRNQGFKHYSARAILHRIRWHYHIEKGMRDFKCNNNWTPGLARWCMALHPGELEDFFELRASPHQEEEDDNGA